MANNHGGMIDHGKRIVDDFAQLRVEYGLNAAIKLQFRQLDTFIHKDFINSDLKYVKRFKDTRLSKSEFKELVDYISYKGFKTCSTAFDNESVSWFNDLDISVIKVASCSVDDWPLLKEVSDINKKIIISTAGASMSTLHKVYDLFKSKERDFAFMHCVGDYPTPYEKSNLNRVTILKQEFPDIEIGYSTHESPDAQTTSVYALAMGCTILEKHIGTPGESIRLNDYSMDSHQFEGLLGEIKHFKSSCFGFSDTEKSSLRALKRGMYFSRELLKGEVISKDDLYFCIPTQEPVDDYHFDASNIYDVVGRKVKDTVLSDGPVTKSCLGPSQDDELLKAIKFKVSSMLEDAKIYHENQTLELSCHYGLSEFYKTGCAIINKINREYCKKLIIVLPNQNHPTHRHIQKEECFELLYGDCTVKLNSKDVTLQEGKPLLVPRGVNHSFKSERGCILEEVSTTHLKGDSIYDDPTINKLPLEKRKITIKLK